MNTSTQQQALEALQTETKNLLENQRQALAKEILDGTSTERLACPFEHLAVLEGELKAYTVAALGGVSQVTRLLLQGADDKWSGRGNEQKRAYYDGVRRGAEKVLCEVFETL